MGGMSSLSAEEREEGAWPSQASSGGGDEVSERTKWASSGTSERVEVRAAVYTPSMSSLGRHIRGTPSAS